MSYIYKHNDIPSKFELVNLYNDLGWTNYTKNPEQLYQAIRNSLKVITVYDDNELVGLIRGVGDGETILYIQDILVKKDHHRLGLGTKLFHLLVDEYPHVRQKVLLTDNQESTKAFYHKMGFGEVSEFNCVAFLKHDV